MQQIMHSISYVFLTNIFIFKGSLNNYYQIIMFLQPFKIVFIHVLANSVYPNEMLLYLALHCLRKHLLSFDLMPT